MTLPKITIKQTLNLEKLGNFRTYEVVHHPPPPAHLMQPRLGLINFVK